MSFKLTALQASLLITLFLFFSLGNVLPASERGSAVSNERRHSYAFPAAERSITLIGTAVSSLPSAVRRGERDLHYTLSRQKAASALSNPEKVVKAVEIA